MANALFEKIQQKNFVIPTKFFYRKYLLAEQG